MARKFYQNTAGNILISRYLSLTLAIRKETFHKLILNKDDLQDY